MVIDDFIDVTRGIHSLDMLKDIMTHAISSYGYERIICYSDIGPNALNFRANTDFYNHYNQRNLKIADPVLHLFFTQNNPFTHKQIQLEFLAPEQQAIMKLYQQSGITNSYSIPVGKISKQWVGVTLSSAETSLIEDGYAQQQLFALVNHFIIRYGYISKHWPEQLDTYINCNEATPTYPY